MTVRRVMGIETEYGIAEPGHPMANPMLLSSYVVVAYAGTQLHRAARARWDYDDEDPLQDARGFHLDRASAHPSVLTDDPAHPAPSGDATPGDGGPGRDRAGGTARRVPARPAGRLHRGRGRPRDDLASTDHQHPRRAARRPGAVATAACDHRRREHARGGDVPQGGDCLLYT